MNKTFVITGILSAFIFFGCSSNQNKDTSNEPTKFHLNKKVKEKITITQVEEGPIIEQLALTGTISYNQNDLLTFKSLLSGVVQNVNFELGDKVRKGEILATIRSNDVIDFISQRKIFSNQVNFLKNQLKIKKGMLKDGLASYPEVNEIETNLLTAETEVRKIDETLSLYRMGRDEGTYNVVAPRDGYIVEKNISIGQTIDVNDPPIFSISNLNQVWVMVNIYASNLRFIKEGSTVKVRTIAYPDVLYDGVIDKIYNVFDAEEHVLKARVKLNNTDMTLYPGMSADIFIDKNTGLGKAIAIPHKAVIFNNDKSYVVIYKNDHDIVKSEIKPVAENENFVYTTIGVSPGDKVITQNALLVFEELNNF